MADYLYLGGWQRHDVAGLQLAARLFPYERSIVTGPAYWYSTNPSPDGLAAVVEALRHDPWSADLTEAEMRLSSAMKLNDQAVRAFYRLQRIAPRAKTVEAMVKEMAKYEVK